jgi:hypothetical protein
MGVWHWLCGATFESSHTKVVNMDDLIERLKESFASTEVVNMDDLIERLRESFVSMEELIHFLRGPTVVTDDTFWQEQIAEDDRLALEGLRDHVNWLESQRRQEADGLTMWELERTPLGSELRIDWLREGF